MSAIRQQILENKTSLGIEFGSTRIKAVLLGDDGELIASGNHDWENRLENGIWTYSHDQIIGGLQDSYAKLKSEVKEKTGLTLESVGSAGISAMMHGYLPFDSDDNLLVPFRTWRNTITQQACEKLVPLFGFNIPQRWSIAHLEQAILNGEEHIEKLAFFTTLAGFVHYLLTGEKVLGVGDASGMFPIDSETGTYNKKMIEQFNALNNMQLESLLPEVLSAGEKAGTLTAAGAALLDPEGDLKPGIPFCPPEGDAGTGMTATNSIAVRTGNISAGTSIFAMVVLEKELAGVYPEIDIVTTPDGKSVAMVHCNNCTGDIDAFVRLFSQVLEAMGVEKKKSEIYDMVYAMALEGEKDCGGILSYNLLSGEPVLGLDEGRPMLVRMPSASLELKNLARSLVYSSFAALKVGMDILTEKETVAIDRMLGHGGLFKTKLVAQSLIASALGVPVAVMPTASEGGAWGIAILARFMRTKAEGETLPHYLDTKVFGDTVLTTAEPVAADKEGFEKYIDAYKTGTKAVKAACEIR